MEKLTKEEILKSPYEVLVDKDDKFLLDNKDVIIEAIKENSYVFQVCGILKLEKDVALVAIKEDGLLLNSMQSFKDDEEIVLEAVKQNGLALQFAGDKILLNKDVIEEAITNEPSVYIYVPDSMYKHSAKLQKCFDLYNQEKEVEKSEKVHISKEDKKKNHDLKIDLFNDKFYHSKLEVNDVMKNIDLYSDHESFKEDVKVAIYNYIEEKNTQYIISKLETELKYFSVDEDIALCIEELNIVHTNLVLSVEEMMEQGVINVLNTFKDTYPQVKQHLFNEFPFLKDDNINKIKDLISKDPVYCKYLSDDFFNNEDLALFAIKKDYNMILEINKEFLKDDDFIKSAIKQNGLILKHLEKLQDNKDIVLLAVKQNGLAIKYVSPRLSRDKEVIEEAIKENRESVLKINNGDISKDVALTIVKIDGMLLEHLDNKHRKDEDVVREAVKQNSLASLYSNILSKEEQVKYEKNDYNADYVDPFYSDEESFSEEEDEEIDKMVKRIKLRY